jgi:anti-anti-sigma factor
MSFSLTQLPRDNGVVPLVPGGDGDTRAVGTLGSAIQGTLDTTHCADLVVDPAQVTFLDCAGIGALVADRNTAVISGRCYTVANQQRQVRRLWTLTGVLRALITRQQPAPLTGRAARSRRSRVTPTRPASCGGTAGTVDRRRVRLSHE